MIRLLLSMQTKLFLRKRAMKKLIILFFCTFLQPLHGELQEHMQQLHDSLVELKNKLSSLQSGLDRLSIKLSGKKAEKEEEVEDEIEQNNTTEYFIKNVAQWNHIKGWDLLEKATFHETFPHQFLDKYYSSIKFFRALNYEFPNIKDDIIGKMTDCVFKYEENIGNNIASFLSIILFGIKKETLESKLAPEQIAFYCHESIKTVTNAIQQDTAKSKDEAAMKRDYYAALYTMLNYIEKDFRAQHTANWIALTKQKVKEFKEWKPVSVDAEKEEEVDDEQLSTDINWLKSDCIFNFDADIHLGRWIDWCTDNHNEIKKIINRHAKEKLFDTFFKFFNSNNFNQILIVGSNKAYETNWYKIEPAIETIIKFFMDSLDTESIKNDLAKMEQLQSAIAQYLTKDYIKQEFKDLLTKLQTKIDGGNDLFLMTMQIVQNARNCSENQFKGLSYFYETLLEKYPSYGKIFMKANSYFQTKIIDNIEKNLTAIHQDDKKDLAIDSFFVVVLICFQKDSCTNIQTDENIKKIFQALSNDNAKSIEEAQFKARWYTSLYKILIKIEARADHASKFIALTQRKALFFLDSTKSPFAKEIFELKSIMPKYSFKEVIRQSYEWSFIDEFYKAIFNKEDDSTKDTDIKNAFDYFINEKITLSNIEDAKKFLFITTSICFPRDFPISDLKKYIEELINNVEQDIHNKDTSKNEALLKIALYTVLQEFLSQEDLNNFEILKSEGAIDPEDLNTLIKTLTSFNTVNKIDNEIRKWARDNQKIIYFFNKDASKEIFNTIIDFIANNDISYLRYFGEEPGNLITTALENFLIRALISDTSFAQNVFETLLRIIAQTSEINKKEELNQAKHKLFFILSLLFKTGYQEEWAIILGLELFSRNYSYDKYNLLESLMNNDISKKIFFDFLKKTANTMLNDDLTLSIPGHGEKKFNTALLNNQYSDDGLFRVYQKFIIKFLLKNSQKNLDLFEQKLIDLDYNVQGKEAESSVKKEKEAEVPDEKSEVKTETLDEKILENIENKPEAEKALIVSKVLESKESHEHINSLLKNQKFLESVALKVNTNNTLKDLIAKTIELVKDGNLNLDDLKSIMAPKILKTKHEGSEVNLIELLIAGIAGNESEKQKASAIFAIIKNSAIFPARKAMAAWFEEWKSK